MNIRLKTLWLSIILAGLVRASVFAQQPAEDNSAPQPDKLYVHLDKPFYATGETIWYKTYFLYQDTSNIKSNIIYLDLISPTGEVLVHQKLLRTQLYAYGEISVPPEWEEGYYTLRYYTRWNLNFSDDEIYLQRIPIYNPYENPVASSSESPVLQTLTKPGRQYLKISLQTQQQVYSKSDSVRVTIAVTDAAQKPIKANLSLAVLDAGLVTLHESSETAERPSYISSPTAPTSLKFAPEKALTLPVTIASPTTSEPVSSQFISVYRIEDHAFINTSVEQGGLSISLPNFFGPRTFQIHNHNPFQASSPDIAVNSILDSIPLPDLPDYSPPRTPEVKRYLYLSKLRNKLYEIFDLTPPVESGDSKPEATAFVPNKAYSMEKYQLMKTVEEFISNVLVKANISSDNRRKSVRLFEPVDQRYLEDSPWYMINGYLTTQEDEVLAMPLSSIEKIEIYLQEKTIVQQFPFLMARGGVIAIYTKDKKPPTELITERNTFTWQGFHPPQPFNSSEYRLNQGDNTPDFRPLVYWEPIIETDGQGKAVITFPTSKAISQFTIQVEGASTKGAFGKAKTSYQTQFSP